MRPDLPEEPLVGTPVEPEGDDGDDGSDGGEGGDKKASHRPYSFQQRRNKKI